MSTLYAGIDLHSNNNFLVVIDSANTVIYEKRLKNNLDEVCNALGRYADDLADVAVESTYNWYWLVDGLQAAGYSVHLANTVAINQYSGLKHSDDKSDARWLAQMLQLNILPKAYIYPAEWRPDRDALRKRSFLVRHRTAHILSIQNIITRNTGQRPPSATQVEKLTSEEIAGMDFPDEVLLALESSAAMVRCANEQIALLEAAVRKRVRPTDTFKNLTTVDGIGEILGWTILLETGNIWRFPTVGNYASYARCVRGARMSNGKKKGGVNEKNGNAYLSWAFSEAAQHAIRYNDKVARFYQRKLAKKHMMVARRTVAHKLARACYYIQRDGVPFDVDKTFGGK
jgi:transposase